MEQDFQTDNELKMSELGTTVNPPSAKTHAFKSGRKMSRSSQKGIRISQGSQS